MKRYKKNKNKFIENVLNIKIKNIKFNSFIDAIKWNGAFYESNRKYFNLEGKQIKEAISHIFKEKGGMITFSTDMNAVIDKKGFINIIKGFFKSKFKTVLNRLKRNKKLADLLRGTKEVTGYSVGNLFKGKYFDRDSKKEFNEKSLSVEIIGISYEVLIVVAEAIAKEFDQKEVLVKDYDSGKIMLVDRN